MDLTLKIFTHPACPRCGSAVKAAWALKEQNPGLFELHTVSLTGKAGLDEAHAQKITTIPATILSGGEREFDRIIGVPAPGDLEKSVNSAITEET
jgi:hypothetical protein